MYAMNLRIPDFEHMKHENDEQKDTILITFSDFDSIKQVSSHGVEYWSARDVRDLLKYTEWRSFEGTLKQAIRTCQLTKQDVAHHFVMTQKKVQQGHGYRMIADYALTRYALHLMLTHFDSQKPEIALALAYLTYKSLDVVHDYRVFAQEIGAFMSHEIALSKEQETIEQIILAFQHHETVKQYKVDAYYIDLYFPVHCIAVECDEHGHVNYSLQKETQRQAYIENLLGCTFVRYNPDAKKFSVAEVIHKIIMLIYHS